MILGETCTRGCRFCNVKTGNPRGEVDWLEPVRVAEAVRDLGWKYLVLTAVDRDDLPDGGALDLREHRTRDPPARSRRESRDSQRRLSRRPARARHRDGRATGRLRSQSRDRPAAHALGARQTRRLRPVATYSRARQGARPGALYQDVNDGRAWARREDEIEAAMDDARSAGVDIFTMGQYLQPSKKHLPVVGVRLAAKRSTRLGALAKSKRISIKWSPARFRAAPTTPSRLSRLVTTAAYSSYSAPGPRHRLLGRHLDRRAGGAYPRCRSRSTRRSHRRWSPITATYTGASPEAVEAQVTTPLEQAINGVQGLRYISSTSTQGVSTITCTFDLGVNLDIAAADVQNSVQSSLGLLPQTVQHLGITVAKNSGTFVMGDRADVGQPKAYDTLA